MMKKSILVCSQLLLWIWSPQLISAHEAYVLTPEEFSKGQSIFSTQPFQALFDPAHLGVFLLIGGVVSLSFLGVILFSATQLAARLDHKIKKLNVVGPLIIRAAISSSFFYAAWSNSILGPELTLSTLPYGEVIRYLLFALAVMIFFGVMVESAAFVALGIFIYISLYFKSYMITYANYFGEIVVLLLFGSRFLSVDYLFLGKKLYIPKLEKLRWIETPVVRILYGVALIFAGWEIKLLHQQLAIDVYNQYHLINFFHSSAEFIAAGAGLSEITIGLFILLGFCMRWTILVSLVFITLSLFYFQELIWPHVMLYGISFGLLINSADRLTLDHYLPKLTQKIIHKLR